MEKNIGGDTKKVLVESSTVEKTMPLNEGRNGNLLSSCKSLQDILDRMEGLVEEGIVPNSRVEYVNDFLADLMENFDANSDTSATITAIKTLPVQLQPTVADFLNLSELYENSFEVSREEDLAKKDIPPKKEPLGLSEIEIKLKAHSEHLEGIKQILNQKDEGGRYIHSIGEVIDLIEEADGLASGDQKAVIVGNLRMYKNGEASSLQTIERDFHHMPAIFPTEISNEVLGIVKQEMGDYYKKKEETQVQNASAKLANALKNINEGNNLEISFGEALDGVTGFALTKGLNVAMIRKILSEINIDAKNMKDINMEELVRCALSLRGEDAVSSDRFNELLGQLTTFSFRMGLSVEKMTEIIRTWQPKK